MTPPVPRLETSWVENATADSTVALTDVAPILTRPWGERDLTPSPKRLSIYDTFCWGMLRPLLPRWEKAGMRVKPLTLVLSHKGRGYRLLKLACFKLPSGEGWGKGSFWPLLPSNSK